MDLTCSLSLGLLLALAACDKPAPPPAGETGSTSTSGDGDGDPTTGDGDGDGDGDPELGEARTVFVTAAKHTANFGGVAGADAVCQSAALAVTGGDTEAAAAYAAWLSSEAQPAVERLDHWEQRFIRSDGSQIAAGWDNFVDAQLDVRINVDEYGNQITGTTLVWTGTATDGSFAGHDCANWTSTDAAELADVGSVDDDGPSWTAFGETFCDQELRLYCIEQGPSSCGDGVLDQGEQCDDQNDVESDGCLSNCEVAIDCATIHAANPDAPDGVYLIDPDGPGGFDAYDSYCDMSTKGGGWTMVFKISSGVDGDAFELWTGGALNADNLELLDTDSELDHYVSPYIDQAWNQNGSLVREARIQLYDDGAAIKSLEFDASGSSSLDWLALTRLVDSSYVDLLDGPHLFFSLEGQAGPGRRFHIMRAQGGCPGDTGWLTVDSLPDGCGWEHGNMNLAPLRILYATGDTFGVYEDFGGDFAQAGALAVFVRQPDNLLINGDAEAGTRPWSGAIETLVNGMNCGAGDSHQGQTFFGVGGTCVDKSPYGTATQDVDVGSMAAEIDAGAVSFELRGFLRDWGNADIPSMFFELLDDADGVLATSATVSVQTNTWTARQTQLAAPVGTRRIRVTLEGNRYGGSSNDSYFDDLVLQAIVE